METEADPGKRLKVAIIGGGLCIYSVSRRYLNEVLLTAIEKNFNVNLHFSHRLISANLQEGSMTFQLTDTNETVHKKADLIIGADGAFSTVRRHFMKQPMFNFSQTYIEHGYVELCMPPGQDGEFAMKPNYLHVWPRGNFMMIALPNQDRSWTITLFMPLSDFEALDSPTRLLKFFSQHFPDSIPLIGKHQLVTDFFSTKPSTLLSIKCSPYHVGGSALIIGDAAHAMVPFYGQGMNAGFEDCRLLDQLILKYEDMPVALKEFSAVRNRDAEAICDLAMYNYLEMRDLVNRRSFLLRKKVDNLLFWLLPNIWVPLYLSVTFTDIGYRECMENKFWQDKSCRRIIPDVINAIKLPPFQYFLYLLELKKCHWGPDELLAKSSGHFCLTF
ncbi:Kynurenine 3-monooxygenase [Cryptotermes secundus]|uniref:Kynurenine 3-monooxygenase n=1 Tax=Cryptotermes secundus TaxID=105785 RepID=A0A2J7PVI5_9NEOP|nr:Kynurenine 3-monooxygenase [Cryptotermes secundus]